MILTFPDQMPLFWRIDATGQLQKSGLLLSAKTPFSQVLEVTGGAQSTTDDERPATVEAYKVAGGPYDGYWVNPNLALSGDALAAVMQKLTPDQSALVNKGLGSNSAGVGDSTDGKAGGLLLFALGGLALVWGLNKVMAPHHSPAYANGTIKIKRKHKRRKGK